MGKRLVDLVANFPSWKGDTYRLAALVAAEQQAIDADRLDAAGLNEAADIVRG